MFYSITGKLRYSDASIAVVECGGVGFKCAVSHTTLKSLPERGNQITLYTYLQVREDALDLFGFYTQDEMECFKLITSVSGVGAKAALAILSAFEPEALALNIATGDAKSLTRAQGVGAKTAQRIVLELKDKMGGLQHGEMDEKHAAGGSFDSNTAAQAISALVALGYSQSESAMAVGRLDRSLSVEEMIKEGLKRLSSNI